MTFNDRKLTTYTDNITALSDRPSDDGITSSQLKAIFDGRTDKEVKTNLNGLIDDLQADTAAAQLGVATVGRYDAGNVQAALEAIDGAAVHKSADETISGVKTFSASPSVPNGTAAGDAVNVGQLQSNYYSKTEIEAKVDMTDGALASLNHISNAGGDVSLAAGTGIRITPNDAAKTVTITATGTALPAAHAGTHAANGEDELTPADIGAAAATHAFTHATNGADELTPADIGAAAVATYTATLTTTWSGDSAPYTQAVGVSGILATDNPHITPLYSADNDTAVLEKEAWSCVSKAVTSEDTITFTCFEEAPTQSISLQVEVVR